MSVRALSPELQKKSEETLNEVPDRICEDLKHIRDWIAKQPHLNARTDDQWLLSFLRPCKFSLQRTKDKLDTFYTFKSLLPEYFGKRDPFLPEIQEVLDLGVFLPLPTTIEPDGPRIILARCEPVDPKKILFTTILKVIFMIVDILLKEDDNFVIAGQLAFFDYKGMTLEHAIQVTPTVAKQMIMCLQNAYPTRPKELHFVNSSFFVETLFNLIKPFMKAKIMERVHIYSDKNVNNVYETVPHSVLPEDYGGSGMCLDELTLVWKRKVESYRDWFMEDSQYYSDETKRPGKPKTSEYVFGVEGSFRKLDID